MVSEMEDIKIAVIGLGKQFLDLFPYNLQLSNLYRYRAGRTHSIKGVARGGIRCGRVRETK